MIVRNILILLAVFRLSFGGEISYNRPHLSACAEWKPESIILPTEPSENYQPMSVFVDKNNTIYVTYPYPLNELSENTFSYRLYEWRNDMTRPSRIISTGLYQPFGMFVVSTGEIYVNYGAGRVDKWKSKVDTYETVAQFCSHCWAIFISVNDMIYCSMVISIVTKSLHSNSSTLTVIAGTGVAGSEANMLTMSRGIFVDINLDLYVTDCQNHRVQLFRPGTIDGITLLTTSNTLKNFYPTDVVLDANQNIYIVDSAENRIFSGTSNNFKCIIGCRQEDNIWYASYPHMAFDNFGNIYYTDFKNRRVRKFLLSKDTCDSPNDNKLSISSTSPSIIDIPTSTESVYMSILTENSSTYMEKCEGPIYYYESIRMNVSKQGYYEFIINRIMGINIRIYNNSFNPLNPQLNLIFNFHEQCTVDQMKSIINLKNDQIYDLVVVTMSPSIVSAYSVLLIGPSRINFSQSSTSNLIQTKYSSEFTINSPECNLLSTDISFDSYCECIKIHTTKEGYYIIRVNSSTDIVGRIYGNNFTLFDLQINPESIGAGSSSYCNNHFKMLLYRKMNTSMTLIVTAKKQVKPGAFSIIVEGPSNVSTERINERKPIIQTNYSSEFNNQSWKHGFHNRRLPQYYFEALEITVNKSDYYMFLIDSQIATYGRLYKHSSFDPNSSHDTSFAKSSSSFSGKFRITGYLQLNMTYVLMITADYRYLYRQGPFSIIVHGFDRIDIKRMSQLSTTTMNTTIHQYVYSSELTTNNPTFHQTDCEFIRYLWFYYESIQINVMQSGNYTFSVISQSFILGISWYEQYFNPYIEYELLYQPYQINCPGIPNPYKLTVELQSDVTYILVVATITAPRIGNFSVLSFGPNRIILNKLHLQRTYKSELTEKSPIYSRECSKEIFHYESIELSVEQNGFYSLNSSSIIRLYGYLYRDQFDPSYPHENLLTQSTFECYKHRFYLGSVLEMNRIYILVVTTLDPNARGSFQLLVTGPNNVTFKRINSAYSSCVVGDQCNPYRKSIGLTMNDLLRDQIQRNLSFNKQPLLIRSTAGITMMMFVIGLVNGICSLTTFQNKELRKVGCVLYLLASSITSLLTTCMFTIKFWFVVLLGMSSTVSLSLLRTDCVFISPVLKLCLYIDGWLNVCVAIERTVNVFNGVTFDKTLSKRIARWMIFILPILIMTNLIHEPLHHQLIEYTHKKYKFKDQNLTLSEDAEYEIEHHVMCVTRYSNSVQIYNTISLFVHLLVPFVANICSALLIIVGTARQRSAARKKQLFKEHLIEQMKEHKQLLISPLILFLLALPRLIISLLSGCVDPSRNPWLYLSAYFISFTPPMLIFTVYVLPSELYTKSFKESMTRCRRRFH